MKLTNSMLVDVVKLCGTKSVADAFLVPMATGMTLALCMTTLQSNRPTAKYVIWPRIDQKSCFKSIAAASLQPLVVENLLNCDQLETDYKGIEAAILEVGAERVCCVLTTTSCFAPRAHDSLEHVARVCDKHDVPHLVNNAYGIQSSKCMHLIEQAQRVGRLDLFVQSTDKNLLVPVGGAIVAGFDKTLLAKVGSTYAGRASSAPTLDVFITLLSLGKNGYEKLLKERKDMFVYLKHELSKVAGKYGERVLHTPQNTISMAMTLSKINPTDVTQLGSMLFIRNVSGTRVVNGSDTKTIGGHDFRGFGSHFDSYPFAYLTAAASVGMTRDDVDTFTKRLDKVFSKMCKEKANKEK